MITGMKRNREKTSVSRSDTGNTCANFVSIKDCSSPIVESGSRIYSSFRGYNS